MALTNSKKIFKTSLTDFSEVVADFTAHFEAQGYTVNSEETATGYFISMTQGGIFKTVSGMKTGLNITLAQKIGAVEVSMEVGIFGKQLLPSAISMLIAWPVLIPQIIGLIQQNKLDKEAYDVIEASLQSRTYSTANDAGGNFCPYCGKQNSPGSRFCAHCGKRLIEELHCPQCGAPLPSGTAFCSNCGAKI